jgi:hypothetical protein
MSLIQTTDLWKVVLHRNGGAAIYPVPTGVADSLLALADSSGGLELETAVRLSGSQFLASSTSAVGALEATQRELHSAVETLRATGFAKVKKNSTHKWLCDTLKDFDL